MVKTNLAIFLTWEEGLEIRGGYCREDFSVETAIPAEMLETLPVCLFVHPEVLRKVELSGPLQPVEISGDCFEGYRAFVIFSREEVIKPEPRSKEEKIPASFLPVVNIEKIISTGRT